MIRLLKINKSFTFMKTPFYPGTLRTSLRASGLPRRGAAHLQLLGGQRLFPRATKKNQRPTQVFLLRRAALRDRHAALRAHHRGHHQGHRLPLRGHERQVRGPPLRLGLPRAARRARNRQTIQYPLQRRLRKDGHQDLQRPLPLDRDALLQGVGADRQAHGPLDRLRPRLQSNTYK